MNAPLKGLTDMLFDSARKRVVTEPDHDNDNEPRAKGELNGYGRCLDCGESYAACPGVYHCPSCSEE